MTSCPIDEHATRIPQMSGLPECLYVPLAARDETSIETYVGNIVRELAPRAARRAFHVKAHPPSPRDERLPIWAHPQAAQLHAEHQVWVHVDYSGYRDAYARAFPDADLAGLVLDHVMNRRVARLKRFAFLRIVPVTRAANSSHGGLSEKWAVAHHSMPDMIQKNRVSRASVQYADLSDIVKMLDMGGGGGLMAAVNEAQWLVQTNKEAASPG